MIIKFLDSVLRGIGQVLFQNNPYSGLLFLCGIFYNSIPLGLAALIGTVASTLAAIIFRADQEKIRNGLFGFNGTLTAIALTFFLTPHSSLLPYLILASIASTILTASLMQFKLPALTAPFVFTTLCFLMASAHYAPSETSQVEGILTATTFLEGLLQGVSQVFFQENIITGILFLIGLIINSRRCFTMALLGSAVGMGTSVLLLGASESSIRSGAFGFNSVLTAIALGSVFFKSSKMAILGAVLTAVAFAGISKTFVVFAMPAMTLPFVITTWICILGMRKI